MSVPLSAFQMYSESALKQTSKKRKSRGVNKQHQGGLNNGNMSGTNTHKVNGSPNIKKKKLSILPSTSTLSNGAVTNGCAIDSSPHCSLALSKAVQHKAPKQHKAHKKHKEKHEERHKDSHKERDNDSHDEEVDTDEHNDFDVGHASSIVQGRGLLAKLIAPMSIDSFFDDFWEKRPLLVKRHKSGYFSSLGLSSGALDNMLRKHHIRYSKNIDITSYVNGKRETHNPPGRATPAEVWDFYNEGCSVRWLNPQTYANQLYVFCAALQEYLECFVGANLYLTPPASQGFAPHYDDIEAFILQLEGRKHWKLYKPRQEKEVLPRQSSGNFSADEIGEPFMCVTLEAGDMLYFPRGTIHQAEASDSHSLHVTLSCYQHNTWADLLEHLLPAALSKAVSEDPRLRSGLPVGHLNYMGSVHAATTSPQRSAFISTVHEMIDRVLSSAPVDAAVDLMAKRFMQDALPPHLTPEEARCSMVEDGDRMLPGGKLVNSWAMDQNTMIKLTRAHCIRLVYESGVPRLYYTLDNTRVYHEEEPGFFEISPAMVPCVQLLVQEYPAFISLDLLPLGTLQEKVEFAGQLWLKGVLLTHLPLAE